MLEAETEELYETLRKAGIFVPKGIDVTKVEEIKILSETTKFYHVKSSLNDRTAVIKYPNNFSIIASVLSQLY